MREHVLKNLTNANRSHEEILFCSNLQAICSLYFSIYFSVLSVYLLTVYCTVIVVAEDLVVPPG